MMRLLILALALVIDRLVGDPDWLWRRFPHPVILFGKAIEWCDRDLNAETDDSEYRWRNGVFAIAVLLAGSAFVGLVLDAVFYGIGIVGVVLEILIVTVFLAQKSLSDHVGDVASALRNGGVEEGREAVARIVGRDPEKLDTAGVCRAAIESLSENFSDGVVAPALWYAVFGLPGLFAYKMLNTADSMIGHKDERHLHFGRATAKLDDLANWIPARLSSLLLACAAALGLDCKAARDALGVALRDAGLHRSPNAGWPEAAMAGALDIALAGPRSYGRVAVAEPYLNAKGRIAASVADIDRALSLFTISCLLLCSIVAILWLLWFII